MELVGVESTTAEGVGSREDQGDGAHTVDFSEGVAAFSTDAMSQVLIRPIGKYRLDVSTTSQSGVKISQTSSTFEVTLGPPAHLSWATPLDGCAGGAPCSQQPVVHLLDAGGNINTGHALDVTISLVLPVSGVNLEGNHGMTVTTSAGSADFGAAGVALTLDKTTSITGEMHTLRATVTTSSQLVITKDLMVAVSIGPAAALVWNRMPADCLSGEACGVQPIVTIQDLGGNTVMDSTSIVSVGILEDNAPPNGQATCSDTKASDGVIAFEDLTLTIAGSYVLIAISQINGSQLSRDSGSGPDGVKCFVGAPYSLQVATPPITIAFGGSSLPGWT